MEIKSTELDSLVWTAEEFKLLFKKEQSARLFDSDSTGSYIKNMSWELDMAKKERAGVISDPRIWFILGVMAGLYAN